MNNDVLAIYQSHPMQDGDVVLLIEEHQLATEIAGLADAWDQALLRNIAWLVQELGAHEVQLGIGRRHEQLRDRDHTLLANLREELAGTGITVHPLVALPAA